MLAHFFKDVVQLPVRNLILQFEQSEMDDVMVMDFFFFQVRTDIEPEAMEHVYFFWSQSGCMWSEIEYLFLSRGFEYF